MPLICLLPRPGPPCRDRPAMRPPAKRDLLPTLHARSRASGCLPQSPPGLPVPKPQDHPQPCSQQRLAQPRTQEGVAQSRPPRPFSQQIACCGFSPRIMEGEGHSKPGAAGPCCQGVPGLCVGRAAAKPCLGACDVQAKLEELFDKGTLKSSDLDDALMSDMAGEFGWRCSGWGKEVGRGARRGSLSGWGGSRCSRACSEELQTGPRTAHLPCPVCPPCCWTLCLPLMLHQPIPHLHAALGEEGALCVVQRLSESDFSRVHSIGGFVSGIIRRVRQDGPDRGNGQIDILPRSVRRRVEDLIAQVWWVG